MLSKVAPGEVLDVLGPLGNGFTKPAASDHLVLVAGGVGIPPIYLFAKHSLLNGFDPKRITFLCGLPSKMDQPMAERVADLPIELRYSTDDGSLGQRGFVSELLEEQLAKSKSGPNPMICACGPEGMLKAVQKIAKERRMRCLLSLESIMPCGVGTCLGCVVKKDGEEKYHRVCREGPVFDATEVVL